MKKIIFPILLVLIVTLMISCGSQRHVTKSFYGKTTAELTEQFGKPTAILKRENDTLYVFEKVKELRSTEISQGKLTLDPMVSPMVQKTERFYFTIVNDKVIKAKLEEEYER